MRLVARKVGHRADKTPYYRYDVIIPQEIMDQIDWKGNPELRVSLRLTKQELRIRPDPKADRHVVQRPGKPGYHRNDVTLPPSLVKELGWQGGDMLDAALRRGEVVVWRVSQADAAPAAAKRSALGFRIVRRKGHDILVPDEGPERDATPEEARLWRELKRAQAP